LKELSYIEEPICKILNSIHLLLPGLSKCVVVYYSASDNSILSRQLIKPGNESTSEQLFIEDSSLENIRKLRNTKDSFLWLKKDEVPFEVESDKVIQMDVFSELEKNVLLLCLQNDADRKKDLVFCYFNENFSNFKISKSDKPLSTENKAIIGILLYNSINSFLNILKNDSSQFISVNKTTQDIIKNLKTNENRLSLELNDKNEMIIAYFNSYLDELSAKGKRFRFSDNAILKLTSNNGDIGKIKKAIRKAAVYLSSVNYGNNEKTLLIEDYLLDFDEIAAKNENNKSITADQEPGYRFAKTIKLLDKLEEAANKLISENKILTSANVGNACEQPVSAPAISDALKKHKGKIISLIKDNPEKWKTIKTEFRPLLNILTLKPTDPDPGNTQTG
jgi:hypothetical protein